MRILSFIPALAALVTAVASVAIPDTCNNSEMKCVSNVVPKREFAQHLSRNVRAMTNAELLRKGLPLNRPVLRRGTPVRRTDPSSVPDDPPVQDNDPPAQDDDPPAQDDDPPAQDDDPPAQDDDPPAQDDDPVPAEVVHTGLIAVRNANDEFLGYVSRNLVGEAVFVFSTSIDDALGVTFQTVGSDDGTQLDITALDSNPHWPFLGLVQASDDVDSNLAPGSYQYLTVSGVANPGTQPGDRPTLIENSFPVPRTAETAVWTFTSSTQELIPLWINEDGTTPAQQAWAWGNSILVGGDIHAFGTEFRVIVNPVKLFFVTQ